MMHSSDGKVRSKALSMMQEEMRERQHAYIILRGLDHQLVLAGVGGLRTFVCAKEPPSRLRLGQRRVLQTFHGSLPYHVPEDHKKRYAIFDGQGGSRWELSEFADCARPVLCVSSDQGGSNLQAMLYCMEALKLRALFLPDPHHRAWNDMKLALTETEVDCFGLVLECVVCMNLAHGPWLSESWHTKMAEAFAAYVAECGPEDVGKPQLLSVCLSFIGTKIWV